MDGGVAGTGQANLQDSLPRSGVAAGARAAAPAPAASVSLVEDQIAASLLNLANPQIGQLIDRLDQTREKLDPAVLDGLLRAAIAAVDSRDLPGAMAAITELVTLDPERGAQLARDARALDPIRGDVNDLLQRLELGAKAEAERTLAQAGDAAALYPQAIALAQRFSETGQHINFVRATELAEAVLIYVPVAPGGTSSGKRAAAPLRRTRVVVVLGWVSLGFLILAIVQFILSRKP